MPASVRWSPKPLCIRGALRWAFIFLLAFAIVELIPGFAAAEDEEEKPEITALQFGGYLSDAGLTLWMKLSDDIVEGETDPQDIRVYSFSIDRKISVYYSPLMEELGVPACGVKDEKVYFPEGVLGQAECEAGKDSLVIRVGKSAYEFPENMKVMASLYSAKKNKQIGKVGKKNRKVVTIERGEEPGADVDADLAAAGEAFDAGNLERAAELYTRASVFRPADPVIRYNLAKSFEALDQIENAIRSYSDYLDKSSNSEDEEEIRKKIEDLRIILSPEETHLSEYECDNFINSISNSMKEMREDENLKELYWFLLVNMMGRLGGDIQDGQGKNLFQLKEVCESTFSTDRLDYIFTMGMVGNRGYLLTIRINKKYFQDQMRVDVWGDNEFCIVPGRGVLPCRMQAINGHTLAVGDRFALKIGIMHGREWKEKGIEGEFELGTSHYDRILRQEMRRAVEELLREFGIEKEIRIEEKSSP